MGGLQILAQTNQTAQRGVLWDEQAQQRPTTHAHLQVEFLEVRLAEVMAYADIPPSMRPALSEFDPTGLGTFQTAMQAGLGQWARACSLILATPFLCLFHPLTHTAWVAPAHPPYSRLWPTATWALARARR